ncbi:MAG: multidrug effflux MFS transporter [Betaproteobacteria bacterium]|nr:multidrug effflux MFS transporter [Betaproteobacteria bacterium]
MSATAPSGPSPSPQRLSPGTAILLLTVLLSFQPITNDLYLPALPTLTDALGSNMAGAQLTLGVMSVCFGLGQLVCGPLADRFGRRPVLITGLALYVAASIASALAPGMTALVISRGIQGVAMAAAVVCARAVLRDLYEPEQGARVLARALTGLGACAVLCPVLGGVTVALAGWRVTLALLGVFGACALGFVLRRFPETAPRKDLDATRIVPMWRSWWRILRHPVFLKFTALSAFTYTGLYAFLAGSSFVLIGHWGVSRPAYGMLMASASLAYIGGTLLCRRLVPLRGVHRTIAAAGWFSLAGGTGMALFALLGWHSPWAILVPQWLYHFGHGMHQPCAQSGAVGPFPHAAGAASALTGFIMNVLAFPVGIYLGFALVDSTRALPLTIFACSIATALAARMVARGAR